MSTEDWIPTTKQVRDGYAFDIEDEHRNPLDAPANRRANEHYFDRWLRNHEAEMLEKVAAELRLAGDALFEGGLDRWSELVSNGLEATQEGADLLGEARVAGQMKRDAEWLEDRAARVRRGDTTPQDPPKHTGFPRSPQAKEEFGDRDAHRL